MSIRKLIEQALEEARDEFAAIITRKLSALMGDAALGAPKKKRDVSAPAKRPGRRSPAGGSPRTADKRTRAPKQQMAALRERVLGALGGGSPMKRAQIVAAAKLDDGETARVGGVLKRLKDEGLLSMQGSKASATYTLRGGAHRS